MQELNAEATEFGPVAALFPGQVGYTICASPDFYEVCFIDTTEFCRTGDFDSERDIIITTNILRHNLLVLYLTGQVNDGNDESSAFPAGNSENADLEQQDFYNYVEKSVQNNITDYTKELTKEKFYNNLKPNTIATVISDFILKKDENKDNVEAKLYTGETGIILDPDSDYIQSLENAGKKLIKSLLTKHEVITCFTSHDPINGIITCEAGHELLRN